MKSIEFKGANVIEDVCALESKIPGTLTNNFGVYSFRLDSEIGEGTITAYHVAENFCTLILDVCLNEEFCLEIGNAKRTVIDLLFCLEGHVEQRLATEQRFAKIGFRQNALVRRNKNKSNLIVIPADTVLKMSCLSFKFIDSKVKSMPQESVLKSSTTDLERVLDLSNANLYLGRLCLKTAEHVKILMNVAINGVADVLYFEAALMNTLASQIERYQEDVNGEYADAPLRPTEIDKIISLHGFILDNISENLQLDRLTRMSGLSHAKLQLGFKYLYDDNVSSYITQKRVELAAKLMDSKDVNVSEVVYAVGFSSRSYFSKIFKNRYGIKPSDYLKGKTTASVA